MFDNPKKELQRLQDRLLAAEEDEWKQDDDPDAALEEVKKILARDDWEQKHREPLAKSYPTAKRTQSARKKPEEVTVSIPMKKKSHTGGLIAALVLETLALIGVVVWWLLWR